MSEPKITLTSKVAKAIAWTELTPVGSKQCTWPGDFSKAEISKYRKMANAAMDAMYDYL